MFYKRGPEVALYRIEQLSRLHDGYKNSIDLDGENLLLLQHEGRVYLIENKCPHMDVSLSDAKLMPGQKLQCRAHGIEFQLEDGKACGPLANTLACLKRYPLIYDGDFIAVEL
ncbi:MAG: nitrite reductase/ring-hydroxylating ferredoxin subunit [Flavobacteriales bacterium]|jgi:nitrite reductase/ring-hydroxylating ferredoxin subunit